MIVSVNLPSLLVFGPQTEFPPDQAIEDLRQELVSNPRLSALKDAALDLPRFWQSLVEFDPSLRQVPGDKFLGYLRSWIDEGGQIPHRQSDVPNHYALPVTVLLQISQYARYLAHLGDDCHRRVLENVQKSGIQGFCVGFLSAIAVANSETEASLGSAAAVALRLAVCIGAYVDQDGAFSQEPEKIACVAIRFREGNTDDKNEVEDIIALYPEVSRQKLNPSHSLPSHPLLPPLHDRGNMEWKILTTSSRHISQA